MRRYVSPYFLTCRRAVQLNRRGNEGQLLAVAPQGPSLYWKPACALLSFFQGGSETSYKADERRVIEVVIEYSTILYL